MSAARRIRHVISRILRKGRIPVVVGIALAVIFLSENTDKIPTAISTSLNLYELQSRDMRFNWRGPTPPHPQIVILGINSTYYSRANFKPEYLANSEALRLMTERPFDSWNRKIYADLIERLAAAGARAIMFDLIFSRNAEGDALLREALEKHGSKVGLAFTILDEEADDHTLRRVLLIPNSKVLPESNPQISALALFHARAGDSAGVIRDVRYRGTMEDELPEAFDDTPIQTMSGRAYQIVTGKSPPDGRHPINFQGPARTYPYLPLEDVFIDSIFQSDDPRFAHGTVFKDKVVFVGPVAEIMHDNHQTPFNQMPGVEVHAQALGDLLLGTGLRESSKGQNRTVLITMVVLATSIVLGFRQAGIQAGSLLAVAIGFFAVAHILFTEMHLIIEMVLPISGFIVVGSSGMLIQFAGAQIQSSHVRSVLDKYVSKNVAKIVVEHSDSFERSLSGERKSVTALFSDVRGFTSIFEFAEAEPLVAQLNEYFQEMVDVVLREDGTLQKFIGDAIMAVWGDTHSAGIAQDAARAVRSALQMQEGLAKLNQEWASRPGRVQLHIGVGINHGEVVVGQVGHPDRMEFTALGDAVNSASRLEGATKQFRCQILVGERVEELTRTEFVYRRVGRVRLKGKNRPIEVYIPLSASTVPAPAWLAEYHEAIDLYRNRQFADAHARFTALQASLGGDDYLCSMYAQSCQELLQTPPPEDWDSAFTLTEK